ncbi:prephenate dehydrogenase [Propionibacteriaceae bacterium Y2011]
MPDGSILVIGVGLVGASIALAATGAGWTVHLSDRTSSHVRVAAGLGAGTVERPEPTDVGLVVVAVPPDACADVVREALADHPTATVTDVASVKAAIAEAVADAPGAERYVGSHPMAGSHRSGPAAANAELFVDRTWVVTPHHASAPERVEQVVALAKACGAMVQLMDPTEHDAAVAAVSHLPHLAAVLVAGQLVDVPAEHLQLSGQGLRDVTRIAGGDPALWTQILTANADALRPRLHALRGGLDELISSLDDRSELTGALRAGNDGTSRIPGKHGQRAVDWAQVVIEIPDAPGALARLFAEVDAAGINVEDVEIEHDQVREVGFLALSVVPDQAAGLRDHLVAAGWDLRA